MKYLALVLANLRRKKVRTTLTIGSFAAALFLFGLLIAVRGAFNQRRKMLKNALEAARIKWPEGTSIDGKRRGETLSIQEFAELTNSA